MKPKIGKSKKGKLMHYSVGALIKRDGKYLLIDRAIMPFGFAGIAGHVDEGEESLESLKREVKEEAGLDITKAKLLFEEEAEDSECSKDICIHYWYVYECEVDGKTERNHGETKSIGWYSKEEIKKLKLEYIWEKWFTKLGIL